MIKTKHNIRIKRNMLSAKVKSQISNIKTQNYNSIRRLADKNNDNRTCHPDESQDLIDSESSSE